jgi:hypothetical protein
MLGFTLPHLWGCVWILKHFMSKFSISCFSIGREPKLARVKINSWNTLSFHRMYNFSTCLLTYWSQNLNGWISGMYHIKFASKMKDNVFNEGFMLLNTKHCWCVKKNQWNIRNVGMIICCQNHNKQICLSQLDNLNKVTYESCTPLCKLA